MVDAPLPEVQTVFLFRNPVEKLYAVSLRRTGDDLPAAQAGHWIFLKQFELGVQRSVPLNMDPEPILRGIVADGYFVWEADRVEPFGTSQ